MNARLSDQHHLFHHQFWMAMVLVAIVFMLIALIARWADHSAPISTKAPDVMAVYEWIGQHRVAPMLP